MKDNIAVIVLPEGFAIVFQGLETLRRFAGSMADLAKETQTRVDDLSVDASKVVTYCMLPGNDDEQFMHRLDQFVRLVPWTDDRTQADDPDKRPASQPDKLREPLIPKRPQTQSDVLPTDEQKEPLF